MYLEDLGEVFADGRIINIKSASIELLENSLKKVREQRVEKIQAIADIVNQIQQ